MDIALIDIDHRTELFAPRDRTGNFVYIGEPGQQQPPEPSPGKPQVLSLEQASTYDQTEGGFFFGMYHADPRRNGPTYLAIDGRGYVYNPIKDSFQLEADINCLFAGEQAAKDALSKVNGLSIVDEATEGSSTEVDISQFSRLCFDRGFYRVDKDGLGHECAREEATSFGACVYVDYPDFDTRTQILIERENSPVGEYTAFVGQIAAMTYPGMQKVESEPQLTPAPGP